MRYLVKLTLKLIINLDHIVFSLLADLRRTTGHLGTGAIDVPAPPLSVWQSPKSLAVHYGGLNLRLLCRCKISVIVYNWSAGHGFPGLFHAIFDNDSSHRPFAFGISHVGMNQERLEMAHLMDNFLDLKFVITVPENDLLRSEAEEAILPALAKIATLETWSIVFVIYGLYAVLLAKFSDARSRSSFAALITRTWNAAYKLFAVSVSQGKE